MGILLLPFKAVFWLIGALFNITGRLIGALLGCLLMIIGLGLTATIFLAIIGIPLIIIGFVLIIKSIFG